MLQAINTKLLIAILAALAGISAIIVHQQHEIQDARAQAAKATALLEQQKAQAEAQKQEYEAFRKRVEAERRKNSAAPTNEGKTWRTYIP